ncbi:MAG: TMEM43 family protein [Acidobacteria bacterium]|nr:TMEM43 family protein [Acidobacteriota bacterium]
MADRVTRVTRQSWGSRIGGAFKGIIVGVVMVALAFWILFWNEGRAVRRYKALKEGAGVVVTVDASRVDPANEGKLVHLTGMAEPSKMLTDPDFGIVTEAIHLERKVEMYQWQQSSSSETKKKLGGGTETVTTYSYSTGWSDRLIDSNEFEEPSGHRNPTSMPYSSREISAPQVTVGAFHLSPSLVQRISGWQDLPVQSTGLLPAGLQGKVRLSGGSLFLGDDPASPRVGDVRISFRQVLPTTVSLASRQSGDTFTPYQAKTGPVELLRSSAATAQELFDSAQQVNKTLTWLLRLAGFVLMGVGFRTVFRIFSVLADVVPLLGNLAEKGLGFFSFALAAMLSLITIAVAWLFYRPLLAIGILILAGGAAYAVLRSLRKAKARTAAVPPPPPPPPVLLPE